MKLRILVAAVALTICAVASPGHGPHQADYYTPSALIDSRDVASSDNGPSSHHAITITKDMIDDIANSASPNEPDLFSVRDDLLDELLGLRKAEGSNLSPRSPAEAQSEGTPTQALEKRAEPTRKITLGTNRQHVGQLTGIALRDQIVRGLSDLCPRFETTKEKNDDRESTCRRGTFKIHGIEYWAKGKLATNAHLALNVRKAIFPEHYQNDGLQGVGWKTLNEVLVWLVATIFGYESMNNCHTTPTDDAARHTWCTVGDSVQIDFDWAKRARFWVDLAFNGETKEGNFDCNAAIPGVEGIADHEFSRDLRYVLRLNSGPDGTMAKTPVKCDT